jgi:hypothetical protein
VHTAPECPSTNIQSQSFPKRKTFQSTCHALSEPTYSLWGCLCTTHMWHVDFDCPKSCSCTCLQPHWHETSPRLRSTLGGENRVTRQFFSSMSTAKSVRATWSLGLSALLDVEFVRNCELAAARIDLCVLRWNASLKWLKFSSEVRGFPGDFTRNRLPVVLSYWSRRLTSILRSKTTLDSRKRLQPC